MHGNWNIKWCHIYHSEFVRQRMRLVGAYDVYGRGGNYIQILERRERKMSFWRPGRIWHLKGSWRSRMVRCGLAHDIDWCLAFVNTVVKFRVPKMRRIFWMAEELSAYQEGLCSMELSSYWIHVKIKFNIFFHVISRLQHQVWQRGKNKSLVE